jgi:hypothetical protein
LHPNLWDLLKKWIQITDKAEFDATWVKIHEIAPSSFVNYLIQYWMLLFIERRDPSSKIVIPTYL